MASLDKTETLAIALENRGEAPHRFDGDRFYSYYKNFTQHLTAKKLSINWLQSPKPCYS